MKKIQFKCWAIRALIILALTCGLGLNTAIARQVDAGFASPVVSPEWDTNNAVQGGSGTISLDQTTNPGELTATNAALSYVAIAATRTDAQLLKTGDFFQVDVRPGVVGYAVGVAMTVTADIPSVSRENNMWFFWRNDDLIQCYAFGQGGAELGGGANTAPGTLNQATDVLTLRVTRISDTQLELEYGINGPAATLLSTLTYASPHTMPTYPGLFLLSGTVASVGLYDNFIMGSTSDLSAGDDFEDGIFDLNWNQDNWILFSSLFDTFAFSETGGQLIVDYTNATPGFEMDLIVNEQAILDDGEVVRMDVEMTTGPAGTVNASYGLSLAAASGGMYNNARADTLLLGLRADGFIKMNAYGNGGTELLDASADSGYVVGSGDVVNLELRRAGSVISGYWGLNAPPTNLVNSIDFSAHTVPTYAGMMSTPGMADFSVAVSDFSLASLITTPTVTSIVSQAVGVVTGATVDYVVTFSEAVTGVGAGNFTVNTESGTASGSINSVSGSDDVWTVTVDIDDDTQGELSLDLTSTAGIVSVASSTPLATGAGDQGDNTQVDRLEPTIISIGRAPGQLSPTAAFPINFRVVFSEPVTGFTAVTKSQLNWTGSITEAEIDGISITDTAAATTFTLSVTGITLTSGTSGTVVPQVPAALVTDGPGNGNVASAAASPDVTYDEGIPGVTIVTATASPTTLTSIVYTVTFTETVTGVTSGLFSTIGTATSSVGSVVETTPGEVWEVTVDVTADGTVNLRLLDDDTIQNAALTPLNGPNAGGDEYVLGNEVTVDQILGAHVVIDLYDDSSYNADSKWNAPLNVQGEGNDILTFNESATPGRLQVDMDASPADYSVFMVTRNDVTLPVGEYIRCTVSLTAAPADPNSNVGIGLMAAQSAGDRAQSLRFALRGDGVVKINGYQWFGVEYADADAAIAGFALGQDYTLQIERVSENEYAFSYGVGDEVTTTVLTLAHPGGVPPTVPAMSLSNGLADFTAEYENYLATAVGPAGPTTLSQDPPTPNIIVDDFLDGVFGSVWDPQNYPQFGNLADLITFDEATTPGILAIDYDDVGGSEQSNLVLHREFDLVPGSSVQVDVSITAGEATPLVWAGLGLATVTSGIYQDRSNTVYYGLRNDGLVRGNFYGEAGVEFGDIAPTLPGYALGDVVSLAIYRVDQTAYGFFMAHNGGAWSLVGSVNYGDPHTPPNRLGMYLGVGMRDFAAEFSNFEGYNLQLPPTAAQMWWAFE